MLDRNDCRCSDFGAPKILAGVSISSITPLWKKAIRSEGTVRLNSVEASREYL